MDDDMRGGPDGPGGWGQMSEEERRAFAKDAREKLAPINRQFGKDLGEVLDEGQRRAVRAKWDTLSLNPPMIERMIEAEKRAKQAKEDAAKKGKGAKKGEEKGAKEDAKKGAKEADDDASDEPSARGKKAQPRQQGKRGGRGGDDDD